MACTVTESALIARINLRIGGYDPKTDEAWGERLVVDRRGNPRHHAIDRNLNTITGYVYDLENYARELGVLGEHESVGS